MKVVGASTLLEVVAIESEKRQGGRKKEISGGCIWLSHAARSRASTDIRSELLGPGLVLVREEICILKASCVWLARQLPRRDRMNFLP
jgi:hypothetical protein